MSLTGEMDMVLPVLSKDTVSCIVAWQSQHLFLSTCMQDEADSGDPRLSGAKTERQLGPIGLTWEGREWKVGQWSAF